MLQRARPGSRHADLSDVLARKNSPNYALFSTNTLFPDAGLLEDNGGGQVESSLGQLDRNTAPVLTAGGGDISLATPVDPLIRKFQQHALRQDAEYLRYGAEDTPAAHQTNYHFATTGHPCKPDQIFDLLRWGGLFVYVTRNAREAATLQEAFDDRGGFSLETRAGQVRLPWLGMKLPGLSTKLYYFTARKVMLIPPGATTDRFTYAVQLARHAQAESGYTVKKEVPTLENVAWRLKEKHPTLDDRVLAKRAAKLVDSVFPVFLTREAAILKILQRDMPAGYANRVPRVVQIEKDDRGFIRCLHLNWLRMSGPALSQLEFAKQSADLLRVLHDKGGMIHLDLRLDNFVISDGQVGFVDFGSAVRVGENLRESPLLTSLFDEMMRTSQIQRLLGKWKETGRVTSRIISDQHHKVDKAIDFFYLAVQMNRPHYNPEFKGLVRFDKDSQEALLISQLTGAILRPTDPCNSPFRSAADILSGLIQVERSLAGDGEASPQRMAG